MDDKSLLELCLKVSGSFESGGGPSYTSLTGNFDGMGLSAGILQWNAGQGTLQTLIKNIAAATGWDKANSFFSSSLQTFASLKPADAIQWCKDHYLTTGTNNVDIGAKARWVSFLSQPESVTAQVFMASNGVLGHAKREVSAYCPDYIARNRPYVFFFDLVTQEGGMTVGQHTVPPVPVGTLPDVSDALALAAVKNPKCHDIWQTNLAGDDLAALLLHYAYARASLANPLYIWDACDRRGSIACRGGVVHAATVDFTQILD
jgi:hypothetical protein